MPYLPYVTGGGRGKITATAATRIRALIGGEEQFFTHLINFNYTCLTAAHTGTIMRSASRAQINGAVAANSNTFVYSGTLTDGDGNAIAASDVIAIQQSDNSWWLGVVSAVNTTTKTIITSGLSPLLVTSLDDADVVCYGVAGDTYHANYQFALAVNASTNFPAGAGDSFSLAKNVIRDEPLVFDSDNATSAGTLNYANWGATYR